EEGSRIPIRIAGDRADEVVPVEEVQGDVVDGELLGLRLEAEDREGLAEGERATRRVWLQVAGQNPRRAALRLRRRAPRRPTADGYRPRVHGVREGDREIRIAEGGYVGEITGGDRNQRS